MPSDLWYFYESNLDKGNLITFLNSLPTSGLKDIFTASMGGLSLFDRDSTNVLQGYEKPAQSSGLQEVKYKWGVSKWLHAIPVSGTLTWLLARGVSDTSWHSIYFDSKTEECLSHDREVAASKLNDKGNEHFKSNRFDEALEYFSNAYTHSSTQSNYSVYDKNKALAQAQVDAEALKKQGDEEFNAGRYSNAKEKYQLAYDKSTVSSIYKEYKKLIDKAQPEIDAASLKDEGEKLFYQSKFTEARDKYKQSYEKSTISANRDKYLELLNKAQSNVDAAGLKEEGDKLYNQKKFAEALVKYKLAYDKSSFSTFKPCVEKAQLEVDASNLKDEGDKLYNEKKFKEALAKYQLAHNKSNFNTFKPFADKAQSEIAAADLKDDGDKLYNEKKFNEALAKYQLAHKKSNFNTFESFIDKAQSEIDAISLKEEGDRLFTQVKYNEAQVKYQQAFEKSSVTSINNLCSDLVVKARSEYDGIRLKVEGDKLFNEGKFNEALSKYQEASKKSSISESKAVFDLLSDKTKLELSAKEFKEQGDGLFNQGKYGEAVEKYQQAYNKSSASGVYQSYNECLTKARAELNASQLKEEGDRLFNQEKYKQALDKYIEAVSKSSIVSNREAYNLCFNRAQDEEEALSLKKQGDAEFKSGKYANAREKYEQAWNLSVASKESYQALFTKVEYSSVIEDFNREIISDVNKNDLKDLHNRLETLLDAGFGRDTSIVTRFLIVSLRMARYEINSRLSQLESTSSAVDELKETILKLIETEIELLGQLNLLDRKLEQQLKSLQSELNEVDTDDYEDEVRIQEIRVRVVEIQNEVERKETEKLSREFHLERG